MGFRIRERRLEREEKQKSYRNHLIATEAETYKRLNWRLKDADQDFLNKLTKIRETLESDRAAQALAKTLTSQLLNLEVHKNCHKELIAAVVKELL